MFGLMMGNVFAAEIPESLVSEELIQDRTEYLERRLTELEAALLNSQEIQEHELHILTTIRQMINSRLPVEQRIVALESLAETHTEMTLPFMWEILGSNEQLDMAIIASIPNFYAGDPTESILQECRNIVSKALYLSVTEPSNFTIAIGANEIWGSLDGHRIIREDTAMQTIEMALDLSDTGVAELLYHYIEDPTIPMTIRKSAYQGLQSNYTDWLATQPPPNIESPENRLANNIYAASTAVTGSVLLGSVGVWGQNETSQAIGYTGGALLGATSGWLISQEERPTLAQATLLASSTGWGLGLGQLMADGFDLDQESSALSRTLGVSAGTGFAYWARDKEPHLSDVIETDFMGYWGAQTAVAMTDILSDQSLAEYPEYTDYDDNPEYYDQMYADYNRERDILERRRERSAVVGSLAGLGAASFVYPNWNPSLTSTVFAGVWSGQMAIASDQLLPALGTEYPQGWVRLIAHTSMAGSLWYDHKKPTTYNQSIFSAYGAGVGYLLGYGGNNLRSGSDDDDGSRNAALLSTLGALGGTTIGNQMNFSYSDWVTTGVGFGLSGWHLGCISNIATDREWMSYEQANGLVGTGLGIAGLGLLGTGYKYEISSSDAIFLGSTAAWGAYFGSLTPIALGVDDNLDDAEYTLLTLLTSDVFLAGGSYAMITNQFRSEQSAVPQVLGLAGATLGSLGAFLFTDSSQVVSSAALLGASAGLITGVFMEGKKPTSLNIPKFKYHSNLPSMAVQVSPYLDDQGEMGLFLGVSN